MNASCNWVDLVRSVQFICCEQVFTVESIHDERGRLYCELKECKLSMWLWDDLDNLVIIIVYVPSVL